MRVTKEDKTHEHCYHAYRGPIMMVIPNGHVVQKCCKCSSMRTVHVDHAPSWRHVRLNGPTLFYIDQKGTPIQMGLNDHQVQMIIDNWNAQPGDSTSHILKPPRG